MTTTPLERCLFLVNNNGDVMPRENFAEQLRDVFFELSRMYQGWDDILVQAMFALATKEHVLWVSEPGQAKSTVARAIFGIFPDARTLRVQITPETLPSALFGDEIPEEYLRTGRQIRNLENGLAAVEFAFLDEFNDAPDVTARSTNTALNERVYESKDEGSSPIPLHTAIMTTNFQRKTTPMQAVRDRVLCKAVVPRVNGITERMAMYDLYLGFPDKLAPIPQLTQMSYADLLAFANQVTEPGGVEVPPEMLILQAVILSEFIDRRTQEDQQAVQAGGQARDIVSPRTEARLLDFVRASALLNGRTKVVSNDLRAMRYGLVMLGDGTTDDQIWSDVCNQLLPHSRSELKKLAELAQVSAAIRRARDECGHDRFGFIDRLTGHIQTSKITMLNKLTGDGIGDGIAKIAAQLQAEIQAYSEPVNAEKFPWNGDWR